MRVLFKRDIRFLSVLTLVIGLSLLALSALEVPRPDQRWYPALASPWFFLMAVGFWDSHRVGVDESTRELVEVTTSWRSWRGRERRVPFDSCQSVIIGGPTTSNRPPPFRRVWLEVEGQGPVLLTTIPRGILGEARKAAQKAGSALGVEVQETRRKFPGDLKSQS